MVFKERRSNAVGGSVPQSFGGTESSSRLVWDGEGSFLGVHLKILQAPGSLSGFPLGGSAGLDGIPGCPRPKRCPRCGALSDGGTLARAELGQYRAATVAERPQLPGDRRDRASRFAGAQHSLFAKRESPNRCSSPCSRRMDATGRGSVDRQRPAGNPC